MDEKTPENQEQGSTKRTFVEEIEVAGNQLVERVKDLIQEGNTRRLVVRNMDGKELLQIPLTYGVVAGGLFAYLAPLLAALGALAALVTRVKLEVVREIDADETPGQDQVPPPQV